MAMTGQSLNVTPENLIRLSHTSVSESIILFCAQRGMKLSTKIGLKHPHSSKTIRVVNARAHVLSQVRALTTRTHAFMHRSS